MRLLEGARQVPRRLKRWAHRIAVRGEKAVGPNAVQRKYGRLLLRLVQAFARG